MTNEEIIKQLQDLECHCQEMYDAEVKNGDTSYSIWGKDVEALTMAIKVLEQQPCEYNPFTIDELDDEDIKKKLREYQNQKVLVTEHDCSPSVTIIKPSEDCISRKELINELKLGYFNNDLQEGKNDPCVIDAMIDWAIRTIKRQPSVTPSYNSIKSELESSEDCISRQTVIDVLKDTWNMLSDANDAMQESIDTIEALPSVTPQPKIARWEHSDRRYPEDWHCSRCKAIVESDEQHLHNWNYCYHCGAKMEVEE